MKSRNGCEEVVDPVCGMKFAPEKAAGKSNWEGKAYYFCNPACMEKFGRDPGAYLIPKKTSKADTPAGVYICPMDPEVLQNKPGPCPKCGMALERQTEALQEEENPELGLMKRRFWISLLFTAPILLVAMGEMAAHSNSGRGVWLQFILATPVVLWGGWPFFQRAWISIIHRSPNMFTLVSMGTGTAYLYSLFAVMFPRRLPESFLGHGGAPEVYFEASAVIITLVLLGQVLELRARSRTGDAIRALLGLAPKTARIIERDGSERDVSIDQVSQGDYLRLRPGERVPVDGVVVEGESFVDESMVTGEPMPVEKKAQSPVTGGTLNGNGTFVMKALKVGGDTLLAQIVRMVAECQRSRAPIQLLVDRISSYFVPAVVLAAAATFAIWSLTGPAPRLVHALANAVAVLIIACPCALGLATPMSVMVGAGRGARAGVLLKNAEALQSLERVDTLVVDKTGTLTEGKPRVTAIQTAGGWSEAEVLRFAASVEQGSEHPLAAAVLSAASERGLRPAGADQFRSITGRGVSGIVEGRSVAIGSRELREEFAADPGPLASAAETFQKQGRTVVFVSIDRVPAGLLAISDPIKQSTPEAIRDLHREGIRIVMITGDNKATADFVARQLGIDEVIAEASPGLKSECVKRLQEQGRIVAMAGDGVNDAPALAQAQVGIAMGTGTDVAIASASVTLVKGDLRGVVRALRLSRGTMRNIRQNLFFAFIYNIVGVPLAAGALYPAAGLLLNPMIASAAMTFSSVSVISNALRLRRLEL